MKAPFTNQASGSTGVEPFGFQEEAASPPAQAARLEVAHDLGAPKLQWDQIPLSEPDATAHVHLLVGNIDAPQYAYPGAVGFTGAHIAFFVDGDIDRKRVRRIGSLLEHHPLFPEATNVELVGLMGSNHFKVGTWLKGRGVGPSIEAAGAVMVAAQRALVCDGPATIEMDGWAFLVTWPLKRNVFVEVLSEGESKLSIDEIRRFGYNSRVVSGSFDASILGGIFDKAAKAGVPREELLTSVLSEIDAVYGGSARLPELGSGSPMYPGRPVDPVEWLRDNWGPFLPIEAGGNGLLNQAELRKRDAKLMKALENALKPPALASLIPAKKHQISAHALAAGLDPASPGDRHRLLRARSATAVVKRQGKST